MDSGWLDRNPAKVIRLPVVDFIPTMPFTAEDMEKILWAADTVREIHPKMNPGIERKLRALILLMRYSGLRISDAVMLRRERIVKGKLFLYQAKTKQPVWIPLPPVVIETLKEIDEGTTYYFWTGRGKERHAPTEWQDRLKKVFIIAGIPDGRRPVG